MRALGHGACILRTVRASALALVVGLLMVFGVVPAQSTVPSAHGAAHVYDSIPTFVAADNAAEPESEPESESESEPESAGANPRSASSRLGSAKITADTSSSRVVSVAANGVGKIPFGPASDDAWRVLNRVDSKDAPLPGYKGGKVWDNNGTQGAQILPRGADGSVTYRRWDLTQKVKGVDRDGRRLVTGSDGSAFYTTDHYVNFVQIR